MEIKAASLSESDIFQMKRDAERRVREMQRLARIRVEENQRETSVSPEQSEPESKPVSHTPPAEVPEAATVFSPASENPRQETTAPTGSTQPDAPSLFAPLLSFDQEQVFLGLLIILLAKEGADRHLILALCYLLAC